METIKELILVTVMIVIVVLAIFLGTKFLTNFSATGDATNLDSGAEIVEKLDQTNNENLNKYIEKYGDKTHGFVAYVLSRIRFYSIPFCIILFVIGSFLYYIVGQEKFVESERGYGMVVASIFFFAIAQIAPLIYTLIITFGRS